VRIDAHVHFLVYDPREHVWVTDELGGCRRIRDGEVFFADDVAAVEDGASASG